MKQKGYSYAAIGVLVGASVVLAYSTGPPDGRTGAPSESNCTVTCHSSFALNSGNGSFSINAPANYTSGDTIDVSLSLSDPDQQRWGFEITVLDAANQPAGELVVVEDTRTQKSTALSGTLAGREYIKHRSAGTDPGTVDVAPGWTVKWAANNGVSGPVTFYAAGNAANNNGFNTGDYIYTTSTTVSEQVPAEPTVFAFRIDRTQTNLCNGTATDALGYGLAVLNEDSSALSLFVTHSVSSPTGAHVHNAAECEDGPIAFAFSSAVSPISQVWALSTTDVANLFAGELYVNIHSGTFPDGEIRGQIVQEPIPFVVTLDEAQANAGAGTGSLASGLMIGELSADAKSLDIEVFHDVANTIDGHIHLGVSGVAGPPVFGFAQFTSPIHEIWMLDTLDIIQLFSESLYVNIHTSDFPLGEIRGQIEPVASTYAFTLDESQANAGAGTGSDATGFGVFTLSPDLRELSIYVEHTVSNPIDGHVHLGAPGVSGSPVFGFTQFTSPIVETWFLTPADLENFLNGDLYVNIHSSDFPDGEIRGQLTPAEENQFAFSLDESQANQCLGTGSEATGTADVRLKPGGNELTVFVTHDVSNPIAGHIHLGDTCEAGMVQFPFSSGVSPITEQWYLQPSDVINLMAGLHYVNIHSSEFENGEIRGQIVTPSSCCEGITGNVDADPADQVDIGDLTTLIAYLYIPPNPEPLCFEEANIDGDINGQVDIGDLTALIAYLYIPPNTSPAACF
jgi:plastocyanin